MSRDEAPVASDVVLSLQERIARLTHENESLAKTCQQILNELDQFKERARLAEREVERLEAILEQERRFKRPN